MANFNQIIKRITKIQIKDDPNWEFSISWTPWLENYRNRETNEHAVQISIGSENFDVHLDKFNPHNSVEDLINHVLHDFKPFQQIIIAMGLTVVFLVGKKLLKK